MATRLALVLLVAAAVSTGVAVLPDEPRRAPPGLGLAADIENPSASYRAMLVRYVAASGARGVRDDIRWSTVQPARGRWDWEIPDAMLTAAVGARLRLLPVLDSTPEWARPGVSDMPRSADDYAVFAAEVVARYGPGGRFWKEHPELDARLAPRWFELYNEPYLPEPEGQEGTDPVAYARTVRAAVVKARAANPAARFLLAADVSAPTPEEVYVPWLAGLYAAVPDLGRFYDGVAVHPYGLIEPVERYTPGEGDRFQTRRIEDLRRELVRRGAGAKPLWITEIGWSTCPADTRRCITVKQQAERLEALWRLKDRWPWVRAIFVYTLNDFTTDADDELGYFGVLRADNSPKPVWDVLKRVARSAGDVPGATASKGAR